MEVPSSSKAGAPSPPNAPSTGTHLPLATGRPVVLGESGNLAHMSQKQVMSPSLAAPAEVQGTPAGIRADHLASVTDITRGEPRLGNDSVGAPGLARNTGSAQGHGEFSPVQNPGGNFIVSTNNDGFVQSENEPHCSAPVYPSRSIAQVNAADVIIEETVVQRRITPTNIPAGPMSSPHSFGQNGGDVAMSEATDNADLNSSHDSRSAVRSTALEVRMENIPPRKIKRTSSDAMAETPRALRSYSVPASRVVESPDKATMRSQITELRDYLQESQHWAQSELSSQKSSFEAAAAQFERVARNVTEQEVHRAEIAAAASAADSLQANMIAKDREAVNRVRNIESEADVSMVKYRQSVDAEAEGFAKMEISNVRAAQLLSNEIAEENATLQTAVATRENALNQVECVASDLHKQCQSLQSIGISQREEINRSNAENVALKEQVSLLHSSIEASNQREIQMQSMLAAMESRMKAIESASLQSSSGTHVFAKEDEITEHASPNRASPSGTHVSATGNAMQVDGIERASHSVASSSGTHVFAKEDALRVEGTPSGTHVFAKGVQPVSMSHESQIGITNAQVDNENFTFLSETGTSLQQNVFSGTHVLAREPENTHIASTNENTFSGTHVSATNVDNECIPLKRGRPVISSNHEYGERRDFSRPALHNRKEPMEEPIDSDVSLEPYQPHTSFYDIGDHPGTGQVTVEPSSSADLVDNPHRIVPPSPRPSRPHIPFLNLDAVKMSSAVPSTKVLNEGRDASSTHTGKVLGPRVSVGTSGTHVLAKDDNVTLKAGNEVAYNPLSGYSSTDFVMGIPGAAQGNGKCTSGTHVFANDASNSVPAAATQSSVSIENLITSQVRLMERLEELERSSKESQRVSIEPLPHVRNFALWKRSMFTSIAYASRDQISTLKWLKQIDDANCIEELENDGREFQSLSRKLADTLHERITGDLKGRVCNLQDELFAVNKFLNGRQLAWLIFQDYKRPDLEIAMLDFDDLMALEIKGENLSAYINQLDKMLLQINERPSDAVLESLLLKNVRKCSHFAPVLQMYEYEHQHKGGPKDYKSLLQLARNHIANRHADKIANQMRGATRSLSVNTVAANGAKQKGDCNQWTGKGQCSRGDRCPYLHDSSKKGNPRTARSPSPKKGKGKGKSKQSTTPKGTPRDSYPSNRNSSNPPRKGRPYDPSKTRAESRGRSPSGERNRPPCENWIQGKCKKGRECNYWHVGVCKFWRQGKCNLVSGKTCVFLHHDPNKMDVNAADLSPPSRPEGKPKSKAKSKSSPLNR